MKKQILSLVSVVTLFSVGCGGGGGSTINYDDPEIIEEQDFYRVIGVNTYLKERFDGNSSLLEEETFENNVSDANRTIPYDIQSSQVYIYDAITIRCWIIDRNNSVEFYCLNEGVSGSIPSEPTIIRWKTLQDAMANPED
jgi:hypothetical protein